MEEGWTPGGITTAVEVVVPPSPGTQDLWATTDWVDGEGLLAGDHVASMDLSNFEGPVRFKVGPPHLVDPGYEGGGRLLFRW